MKKIALAGVAAAALFSVPAFAVQQTPMPQAPARSAMAPISRADIQAKVQAQFARVDANRDGFITQAEAQGAAAQFKAKRAARQGQGRADMFARLDTNKDGAISRAEFDAHAAARGARPHKGGPRGGAARGNMGARMFANVDVDKDGRISIAEATTARLARFDRLDTNRDGTLTPEERRAAREMMRAQHRGRRNG